MKNLKTAALFWKGSDIWRYTPDIWLAENLNYTFKERIDEVFNWFNKFELDICFVHFNQPDEPSHDFGLDSAEYNKSVDAMDKMVGYVMEKLEEFKLKELLNVIVLSDHGMVNLFENNQTILIESDLADMLDLNKTLFAMPHAHIYPLEDSYVTKIFH